MSSSMNIVAHNLQGMFTDRQLGLVAGRKEKSAGKLSSGYRINRSADDAAGLAISEKMRRQIKGLTQGTANAQDGISMCQIADGALAEVHEMLNRITELSVQSANDANNAEDGDLKFTAEKSTKNTVKFAESVANEWVPEKIGSLYVPKFTLAELGYAGGDIYVSISKAE